MSAFTVAIGGRLGEYAAQLATYRGQGRRHTRRRKAKSD